MCVGGEPGASDDASTAKLVLVVGVRAEMGAVLLLAAVVFAPLEEAARRARFAGVPCALAKLRTFSVSSAVRPRLKFSVDGAESATGTAAAVARPAGATAASGFVCDVVVLPRLWSARVY